MDIIKHSITLRSFKKYHPRQIAKFVKAFFNGRIFIVGLGRLRMVEGKVVAYKYQQTEQKILKVVSEINQLVAALSLPSLNQYRRKPNDS
jgi:D-arabinose 5-phosphate isomerase GutQ